MQRFTTTAYTPRQSPGRYMHITRDIHQQEEKAANWTRKLSLKVTVKSEPDLIKGHWSAMSVTRRLLQQYQQQQQKLQQ